MGTRGGVQEGSAESLIFDCNDNLRFVCPDVDAKLVKPVISPLEVMLLSPLIRPKAKLAGNL